VVGEVGTISRAVHSEAGVQTRPTHKPWEPRALGKGFFQGHPGHFPSAALSVPVPARHGRDGNDRPGLKALVVPRCRAIDNTTGGSWRSSSTRWWERRRGIRP